MEEVNFENTTTIRLTIEHNKSHDKEKYTAFVEKSLKINMLMIKKYCNIRDHHHYTGRYRFST